jgi:phenylacetate-CoA ligase
MNWLFKFVLKVNGFPINSVYKYIQKNKRKDSFHLQIQKSKEIFDYHYNHNLFYQKFLERNNFKYTKWKSIPILQKSDIQKPLEDILSNTSKHSKLHIHNTSGSSGTPFIFAKDKFCHANGWVYYDQRLLDLGINYGSDLQARFYGIPKVGLSYWKERLKDQLAGRYRYPVFDLSDEVLDKILIDFKRKKFVYINGYTNAILLFANYLIRKNIVLKNECHSLKCVIPTSEVCTEVHRDLMCRAFGVPVYIEYGAAELDVIAMENANGEFLVNHQTLLVEILDENNEPVQPGDTGRVIVTSLYNKAMPFIRYELGDRATLSPDSGDIQILKNIEGRINDTILLPSGKTSPGLTIYYVVKVLFEGELKIQEFIFHQDDLNHFRFEYVASEELTHLEKEKIKDSMKTYLEDGLQITFIRKNALERTKAGKLKTFISHIQ